MKFFAQWIVFMSVFLWTQQVFSQASNTIQISDAYARATSPGQVVGAGYLTISNLANTISSNFGPTRIYNLGINTLAQVPVNAFGKHFNRHGLTPVQEDYELI